MSKWNNMIIWLIRLINLTKAIQQCGQVVHRIKCDYTYSNTATDQCIVTRHIFSNKKSNTAQHHNLHTIIMTAPISMIAVNLFKLFTSSWFNVGLENHQFILDFYTFFEYVIFRILLGSGVTPPLPPNLTTLSSLCLCLFLGWFGCMFVNLVCFFFPKEPAAQLILCMIFLFSTIFFLDLIISFFLSTVFEFGLLLYFLDLKVHH